MNPPAPLERDQNFAIMGGGNFHGVKNWKLFVAHLSGFLEVWNKKSFPPEQKMLENVYHQKKGGNKWAEPSITSVAAPSRGQHPVEHVAWCWMLSEDRLLQNHCVNTYTQ
jgi:hypothetical protein